jgi:hypothetical protein
VHCPHCKKEFLTDIDYIEHLIENHTNLVKSYLAKKLPSTHCPGGCNSIYWTNELTTKTFCVKDGYEIGKNLFIWAATLVAADQQKNKMVSWLSKWGALLVAILALIISLSVNTFQTVKYIQVTQPNVYNQQISEKLKTTENMLNKVEKLLEENLGDDREITDVKRVVQESKRSWADAQQLWMNNDYFEADRLVMNAYSLLQSRPAGFIINDLTIIPSITVPNQAVEIKAQLKNIGMISSTRNVELKINGTITQVKEVSIDAENTERVDFVFVPDTVGDFQVEIYGLNKQVTVATNLNGAATNWSVILVVIVVVVIVVLVLIIVLIRRGQLLNKNMNDKKQDDE